MTNHAQEATDLLKPLQALTGKDAAFDLEVAQVHATLALVEQQRATNLILATALSYGWGKADVTATWDSVNDTPRWEAVRAEIAAALGITEE